MGDMVKVTAQIRENATGIVREVDTECFLDEDQRINPFNWSEGNFACDCNRALFFLRAAGEPEPEDTPCGSAAFAVRLLLHDGAVIYDELEEQTHG